ncbi:MAG: hypothetical protein HUU38_30115 [Anaerolineales bacterium]|nr:hypothetical protein [Anaerolineales bacterium]
MVLSLCVGLLYKYNALDGEFCLVALQAAWAWGTPEIFNTDQGRQFTAQLFTTAVETAGSRMRMDGKGRALENIFIELLWRSVNPEKEMLKDSWPPSAKTLPAAYTACEPQNLNRT